MKPANCLSLQWYHMVHVVSRRTMLIHIPNSVFISPDRNRLHLGGVVLHAIGPGLAYISVFPRLFGRPVVFDVLLTPFPLFLPISPRVFCSPAKIIFLETLQTFTVHNTSGTYMPMRTRVAGKIRRISRPSSFSPKPPGLGFRGLSSGAVSFPPIIVKATEAPSVNTSRTPINSAGTVCHKVTVGLSLKSS